MQDFPALEVVSSSSPRFVIGMRVRVDQSPFVIGRAVHNPVVMTGLRTVARQHCQLVHERERWWLYDNGTANGTYFLGRYVTAPVPLEHGDVFDVAGEVCFRLLLRAPLIDVREPKMEQALIEDPTDDHRWSVYADWLLEQGAPLGERMAHPRTADELRWLGPLARAALHGELEVTWSKGVPFRAVIRHLGTESNSLQRSLQTLLALPIFRFLRFLEIDRSAFHREEGWSSWTDRVLELIGEESLPMLESLKIGPATPPAVSNRVDRLLSDRRRRNPRFITTPERLHTSWSPATLQRGTVVHSLPRGVAFQVGPSGSDLEIGPNCPPFSLMFEADRWRLTVDPNTSDGVKVNGVPVRLACLRPRDELEPVEGVRLQFNA